MPGDVYLGRTLPSLLDEACDRHPNDHALNDWARRGWQSLSNQAFRTAAEEVALGLLDLALQPGDRVALLMHSDTQFCLADLGSLLASLVNVPIDLTQTIEHIIFILQHTEAKVLVVSSLELLYQIIPYLGDAPALQMIIVADVPSDWAAKRAEMMACASPPGQPANYRPPCGKSLHPEATCLHIPMPLYDPQPGQPCQPPKVPQCVQLISLEELRLAGRPQLTADRLAQLRAALDPQQLATIIYIAGAMGRPKGVMLTHENISADILSAFASHPTVQTGPDEVVLSFLPLTHIFARAFLYGHLHYGHSVYFSTPSRVVRHMQDVRPTLFITVPRLLEKVYSKIVEQGQRLRGFDRAVFDWAMNLARRYEIGRPTRRLYAAQLRLADRLVFARWRQAFGGRIKTLISGGATLRPDLANLFTAAGIPLQQGYGLTETSAVLCYTRGAYNRAGTVGGPIPGVELAITPDGEILVKAPYITQGYYKDPAATQEILAADGWLHTGDLGELTADGLLRITGLKKSLFKLATGKYVSSVPLEQHLNQSELVDQAIAVGAQQKFCAMLIRPNLEAVQRQAEAMGLAAPVAILLQHPCILARYQALIDAANCHLPHWSNVKQFRLIEAELTVDNGLLLPSGLVNHGRVAEVFGAEIAALYGEIPDATSRQVRTAKRSADSPPVSDPEEGAIDPTAIACPIVPAPACPAFAQSLLQH